MSTHPTLAKLKEEAIALEREKADAFSKQDDVRLIDVTKRLVELRRRIVREETPATTTPTPAPLARRRLMGHTARIFDTAFSSTLLATASEDASIRLWNVSASSARHVRTLWSGQKQKDEEMLRCAFSPDASLLAGSTSLGFVFLWDPKTGKRKKCAWSAADTAAEGEDPEQMYICTFLDARRLVAGGEDTVRELDVETMRIVRSWKCASAADVQIGGPRNPEKRNYVFDACIGFGGCAVAVAAADGAVHVRDMRVSREVASLLGHKTFAAGCAVSSTGGSLVSCAGDGTVCLWDCRKWSVRATFRGHERPAYGCGFDGERRIMSWSADGSVRWWDASAGDGQVSLVASETWSNYPIYSCSKRGGLLAVGGGGGRGGAPMVPAWLCATRRRCRSRETAAVVVREENGEDEFAV